MGLDEGAGVEVAAADMVNGCVWWMSKEDEAGRAFPSQHFLKP
jgi:hypothetical protein